MNWPDIQGWMEEYELNWLYWAASQMDSIVEVGSWKGRATFPLCSGCKGMVYAVDHFKGSPEALADEQKEATSNNIYEEFKNNMQGFSNLKVLKMDSLKASQQFKPGSIDMVFLDGSHSFQSVLSDLLVWTPICKKLLCGHDILENGVPHALFTYGFTRSDALELKIETGKIWSHVINGQEEQARVLAERE